MVERLLSQWVTGPFLTAACLVAMHPAAARVDPVGTWHCLAYGHSAFGDENLILRLAADGTAALARISRDPPQAEMLEVSAWESRRGELSFADRDTARQFSADLDLETLGGTWSGGRRTGGWWCAKADYLDDFAFVPTAPAPLLPPLVAEALATPWYPRAAIRAALEGTAVGCFTVTSDGWIHLPHLLELSDPIFAQPTTGALTRSRFAAWSGPIPHRPGCRRFDFFLDAVQHPPPGPAEPAGLTR